MQTRLIAVTQPLIKRIVTPEGTLNQPYLTAEEFIVYCARVSNPSNQNNVETGPRLLRYCVKNHHWSIFEQVSCTFQIITSRAIAAQILRHRSFTFQEFSQRYAEIAELEPIEWREQGKTNRQVGDKPVILDAPLQLQVSTAQKQSYEAYQALIKAGIAKESARMILPLNTQTTIYMTGTLRSWIHYLELRCEEGTQKEHKLIALDIKKRLEEEFPETFKVINES